MPARGFSQRLLDHLSTLMAGLNGESVDYHWIDTDTLPNGIGHLSAFMGNAGVLLRAYFYAMVLGREGMIRVGEYSTLAANYPLKRLEAIGCQAAYPSAAPATN